MLYFIDVDTKGEYSVVYWENLDKSGVFHADSNTTFKDLIRFCNRHFQVYSLSGASTLRVYYLEKLAKWMSSERVRITEENFSECLDRMNQDELGEAIIVVTYSESSPVAQPKEKEYASSVVSSLSSVSRRSQQSYFQKVVLQRDDQKCIFL